MSASNRAYVLITPARNEEAYIERTIKSVIAQTIRPAKWVIVSDGSTDSTDEIVKPYVSEHDWIDLLRMPERKERHFAGKAFAFNAGYLRAQGVEHQFVGNLDGDISFDPEFFAFLLGKFDENPRLGMAGTPFKEEGKWTYDYRFMNRNHVSGQCQLFRRECFETIGGYRPVKGGGIDMIAVITAQMAGWQTRTFPEKYFHHHRVMGTAKSSTVMVKFKNGQQDYSLGGHPVWELCRALGQMRNRPFFIGGAMLLAGYVWSAVRRVERPVSREFVTFRRCEQMQRLRRIVMRSTSHFEGDDARIS
jgi:biofilm PGA synthesis N-glycosyltransferase PgaC